jgi:lysophospholipase L1-like esterase
MIILPGTTFRRSEIAPNAVLFGGGIPISARCLSTVGPSPVTGGSGLPLPWQVANTNGTYRQKHPLVCDAAALQLVFFGYGQSGQSGHDGEENPTNTSGAESFTTLSIKAGIECRAEGTGANITYPVFFKGSRTGSLDPGGILVSDPLGVYLKTATQNYFYTRTYVSSANQYPLGCVAVAGNNEGFDSGNDDTGYNNATGSFSSQTNPMFGPWLVLGVASSRNQPVIGCVGESIMTGAKNNIQNGSTITTTSPDVSFLDVALNNTYPLVKLSKSSDTDTIFSNTRLTNGRHIALSICTHVFVQYGTNNINNAVSPATIYANLQAICKYIKLFGARVYLCTIPPRTTSSDNWATAGNQTVTANEANRVTLNTSIRGAVADGTADAVVDICTPIEVNSSNVLTQNGGIWLSNGTAKHYTPDGIHPAYDGNQAIGTWAGFPTTFSV